MLKTDSKNIDSHGINTLKTDSKNIDTHCINRLKIDSTNIDLHHIGTLTIDLSRTTFYPIYKILYCCHNFWLEPNPGTD